MGNPANMPDATAKEKSLTRCTHCGDALPETGAIRRTEEAFCCDGCEQVYDLLQSHGLNGYYQLPGRSSLRPIRQKTYDWMNVPEVAEKLYLFNDGSYARINFYLSGMHCASCIWLLEKLPNLNPAILRAEADITTGLIQLSVDPGKIQPGEIAALLDTLGYSPEVQGAQKKPNRKWLYKLGIAGFCFGNVMLFSFPEYLGLHPEHDALFFSLFGYLNLFLSIPALFYSGIDFLKNAWRALQQRSMHVDVPLALGMVALFGTTAYDILSGTGPGYADSLTGLIFFLLVGKWYQEGIYRRFRMDRDYEAHLPMAACKIEDNQEVYVPIQEVKVSDIVRVKPGEVMPADGRLERGEGSLDYALITGESAAVPVSYGEKVFAGAGIISGTLDIKVSRSPDQSYLASLWKDAHFRGQADRSFMRRIDRVAGIFIQVILLISAIAFIAWLPQGADKAWRVLAAILIITCPCALALSMPFIFGNMARILAADGMYLRDTGMLERMAKINLVALDKTGTLTVPGAGTVTFNGPELKPADKAAIGTMAHASTHPLSKAIASSYPDFPAENDYIDHIPGKGILLKRGEIEYKLGSASWLNVTSSEKPQPGSSLVYVSKNGESLGHFYLKNEFRPGVQAMLQNFGETPVHIISGDHDAEATRLAQMGGSALKTFFKMAPDEKVAHLKQLKTEGHTTLFVGDGLNDTGALSAAAVGLAVTDGNSGLLPASDGILPGKVLHRLPYFIKLSKQAMNLTRFSLAISLSYNVVGLAFAVSGNLSPLIAAIIMPMSSVSVVAFALISTHLSAFSARKKFRSLLSHSAAHLN
jgi:P-type Cu+ transporter